jgi:serine/threonine protein phosphatase PrpC
MEDGHKIADPLPLHTLHGCRTMGSAIDEQWRFFAVYDGHGGRQAMEWLEQHLHHFVANELQSLKPSQPGKYDRASVADALKNAFKQADHELATLGAWKYGSTATVALIHESLAGKTLYLANVGDSRAVLVSGNAVKQLSADHHATNPVEAARVERDGGCIFRKRVCGALSVTRALGDLEFKQEGGGVSCEPDVSVCSVHGAKALVIASDGVWDVLNGVDVKEILEDCIVNAMEKATGPAIVGDRLSGTAAQALVDRAKDLGSRDNICALVTFL